MGEPAFRRCDYLFLKPLNRYRQQPRPLPINGRQGPGGPVLPRATDAAYPPGGARSQFAEGKTRAADCLQPGEAHDWEAQRL
jgi:hypothetical protein